MSERAEAAAYASHAAAGMYPRMSAESLLLHDDEAEKTAAPTAPPLVYKSEHTLDAPPAYDYKPQHSGLYPAFPDVISDDSGPPSGGHWSRRRKLIVLGGVASLILVLVIVVIVLMVERSGSKSEGSASLSVVDSACYYENQAHCDHVHISDVCHAHDQHAQDDY